MPPFCPLKQTKKAPTKLAEAVYYLKVSYKGANSFLSLSVGFREAFEVIVSKRHNWQPQSVLEAVY
mgnify:CR=1 FL=1